MGCNISSAVPVQGDEDGGMVKACRKLSVSREIKLKRIFDEIDTCGMKYPATGVVNRDKVLNNKEYFESSLLSIGLRPIKVPRTDVSFEYFKTAAQVECSLMSTWRWENGCWREDPNLAKMRKDSSTS
ncbi:hypothetical protein GUITHDRAFT_106241 [Guillardia theta CCMP2712]|uniref:Uncharacterized protein n=1 Tax=Guillardia theta (strain CCMP2712) TaxID=905079 RepID=L1JI38_GUITC|nr:hypothetical protein GUITHDRAFT_106241 [Guillardia theta CCMP2712]EKX48166.1 hypothetical protein GUITHDRAFT_106241 [Guillardia theta CCMP2712]|mmetsp:Transcript_42555/g.134003  ORF Transcript_42555/g.134003 Transcript_42555/m.134003 type:complete len:128 (-) Transcript_42555:1142-1525(-)|eukprot:XP_005835146.1 hypothetical protein GUITHDRAFT_106241 [Guillardia theta CCMP2712]